MAGEKGMYSSSEDSWSVCWEWMEGVRREVSLAWPAERTVKARRRAERRVRREVGDIESIWGW